MLGAGSVGLNLAGRLAQAGHAVLVVTRRPAAAESIGRSGIQVVDPASGDRFAAQVEVALGLGSVAPEQLTGPVLLCCRIGDLASSAEELAARAPGAAAVCVQNGLAHEAGLADRFARLAGVVVRQTATREGDSTVLATGRGRLVVGAFAGARDLAGSLAVRDALAGAFCSAGFDTGTSDDLEADRWLKLCINLLSAPNALVRREDHATPAFVELKARLLEEARDAFGAARVEARSCDGRDRSLEDEIRYQRESLTLGTSARRLPIYNSVWVALRHGLPLEVADFHRLIVRLSEDHGLDAPLNRRLARLLARRDGTVLAPESLAAADLLGDPVASRSA